MNVRPAIYWLELFSEFDFWPDAGFDASFLAPHAMLLKKAVPSNDDFKRLFSEYSRYKTAVLSRATALQAVEAQLKDLQEAGRIQAEKLEKSGQIQKELTATNLRLRGALEEEEKYRADLLARAQAEMEAAEKAKAVAHAATEVKVVAFSAVKAQAQADMEALRQRAGEAIGAAQTKARLAAAAEARASTAIQQLEAERALVVTSHSRGLLRGIFDVLKGTARRARRKLRSDRETRPGISTPAADPQERELQRCAELLAHCPLFDSKWYYDRYPDVAEVGADPIDHYLRHGAAEGRNPGPDFDGRWYLEHYPDVAEAGANPLVHYVQSGSLEGREVEPTTSIDFGEQTGNQFERQAALLARCPLFEPRWYYDEYPDVRATDIDAVDHYLRYGAAEGRNPGPNFDGNWYLWRYPDVEAAGFNPLWHYLEYGLQEGRETRPIRSKEADDLESGPTAPTTVERIIQARFPALTPLRTFLIPKAPPRLSLITDSINAGSLYGGVGTAIILSALVAERIGASLRLVTRVQPPEIPNFDHVLAINGITWRGNIDFLHSPPEGSREVPVSANDVFLTTSWWTTRAVRGVLNPSRMFYLLQEDERTFYPFGDERLRCEETLSDPDIQFVINSELLFEHLTTGPEAIETIREHGMWFEPAFPANNYYPDRTNRLAGGKRNFFFYARPENLRNLYWRGLEAITAAVEEGILRPEDWNFYFVGRSLKGVSLPRNIKPTFLQNLPWDEYAALVRRMDLGLCLMDTPHSSYPPLDLAASGAVVVTNKRGVKTSLSRYSDNVLCAEPTVEALKDELAKASSLAQDEHTRFENYARNRMLRDWRTALEPIVQQLALAVRK